MRRSGRAGRGSARRYPLALACGFGIAIAVTFAWSGCSVDVPLGRRLADVQEDGGLKFDGFPEERCFSGGADDNDGDGFTVAQGDCNDCSANVNPDAVEVVEPPGVDEDCDGLTDEPPETCDNGLALDDPSAVAAARAMELCHDAPAEGGWGLVSARWVIPTSAGGWVQPTPVIQPKYHLGHGIFDSFGPHVGPRHGARMLALSGGTARRPGDEGYVAHGPNAQGGLGFDKGIQAAHPAGFPLPAPSCPDVEPSPNVFDPSALELVVRAPSNAKAIRYAFKFYTYEWPNFVCDAFDDVFLALLDPPRTESGNISFDELQNPVSVNNLFLDVCGCPGNPPEPCAVNTGNGGVKLFDCEAGNLELIGTGFGVHTELVDHGATSWLATRAPVDSGEDFTLRLVIYDVGDPNWDSLVLVDAFSWDADAGQEVSTDVLK